MISKDDIKNMVLVEGIPVFVNMDTLKECFGFKRVDGLAFSISKLIKPSLTEREASTLSKPELIEAVESWCKSNGILYQYQQDRDAYILGRPKTDND
jgi:hypothetical protein